jgi:ABC-2 type transport system permease protein
MFIGPIAQLLLFGYAINLDVNAVPLVICDNDHSSESRALVQRFTNSGYFPITGFANRSSDIDRYLEDGRASLALIIPQDFGKNIERGQSAPLQAIVDGSESNAASSGLNYASMIVAGYSQSLLLESFASRGLGMLRPVTVMPEVRVWYNPELRSRNYLLPGILGMILLQATVLLTALAIVKEKERGTMEQLIVTPIKPWQIIVGKLTPFLLIGIVDIVLSITGVTVVLGVPLRGSVLTLGALSTLFIFTTLGLGLFISTVSSTQQQAMMTTIFFVIMPMNFLSGFFFPIETKCREYEERR